MSDASTNAILLMASARPVPLFIAKTVSDNESGTPAGDNGSFFIYSISQPNFGGLIKLGLFTIIYLLMI